MAVIDSNNFITHLVWSGLVDKATCGELKEAIELCTVKDIYTKDDMVTILTKIQTEIEENSYSENVYGDEYGIDQVISTDDVYQIVQQKINSLNVGGR